MPPIFGAGTDAETRAPAGSASRAAAAGDAVARQPAGTQPGAAMAGEEAAREQLDFEQRLVGARDVFVFDYGCVVFWGTRSAEEEEILERIRVGHNGTLFQTANVEEIENDDMEFMYGIVSQMQRDEVCLRTTEPDEKLAVSFAFSQSVMLSVFEGRVEDAIRSTEHYPQLLVAENAFFGRHAQALLPKVYGVARVQVRSPPPRQCCRPHLVVPAARVSRQLPSLANA